MSTVKTRCMVIERLSGSEQALGEWVAYMDSHRQEALESLKQECRTVEGGFVLDLSGKRHLIGADVLGATD